MPVTTPGETKDKELTGSWFSVELDNGIVGFFTDASGLSIEIEVVEKTDTGVSGDTRTRRRPGTTKYGDITLKRGLTADKKFWEWAKKIRDGNMEYRTNGALVMFDMSGEEVGRWSFTNAWPSKWSASDLDVGSDDEMTEEVTLAIEEIKRDK
jgi:phage tail-like protein